MDFSKFTSENFDAKDWINDVFQNADAQANREPHATTLVMKLQLLIQEVAKSLEDTSQQIVQSMPRIKREIGVMQQEAGLLQTKMKAVEHDVQKVEKDTAAAMDSLLLIDLAKSRMIEVEKALKEVDNWATFTRDIEQVFASGNPDAIADRLIGMQQSLNVLGSKVHDYKNRHDLLERLKDQFVAAVSPSVVSSLTSQSLESSQYFAKMFFQLERLPDFENYCHIVVKGDINKQWSECLNNEDLPDVLSLLNAFYDSLLALWFAKIKWFSSILKNANSVMCLSFTKSLASLDPTVQSTITNRLSANKENSVGVLVQSKKATEAIVRSMESYLHGSSDVLKDSSALCLDYLEEFYKPYSFFVRNYQQYEQTFLLAKLNPYNFDSANWTSLNRLSKSTDSIFAEAYEALDRCQSFTHNYGLPFLLKAFNTYFENYLPILKRFLDNANKEMKEESWDHFENMLKFTEICGCVMLHLSKLADGIEVSAQILKGKMSEETDFLEEDKKSITTKRSNSFDRVILANSDIRLVLDKFLLQLEEPVGSEKFLKETRKQLDKLNKRVHHLATEILLLPFRTMVNPVPKLMCWSSSGVGEALSSDLPSFGLAPQEYVTKIGQYLMTFTHHLEPYLSQENIPLRLSLNSVDSSRNVESGEQMIRFWLECAGGGLMQFYMDAISAISELSPSGCKQLAVDIEYLCNVLEDLGIQPTESLSRLTDLLKMSKEEFREVSPDKFNPKLLSALKEMRRFK